MVDTESDRERRDELVDRLVRRGYCSSSHTEAAMRTVPRHAFVPAEQREHAYEDRPLPIGSGQTISAPHMVAMMVDILDCSPGDRVLEVGTGCGYHAAVMAEVVGATNLYSIEVVESLLDSARGTLEHLGYGAITTAVRDGHSGWPDHAPFDAIYLTCATPTVPEALIDQLVDGGTVLAPVGQWSQQLVSITRSADGTESRETHGGVRFVRMQQGD